MNVISVGSDPEFFLYSIQTGEIVPAYEIFEGTKIAPQPMEHGFVSSDNIMMEINPEPGFSAKETQRNYMSCYREALKIVSAAGLAVLNQSVIAIKKEIMEQDRAWEFGCDPDYSFWDNMLEKVPPALAETEFSNKRFAGGHIHIGLDKPFMEFSRKEQASLIFYLEYHYLIRMSAWEDSSHILRRKFYGSSGSIRLTEYGIEYRVPSNGWAFNQRNSLSMFEMFFEYNNYKNFIDRYQPKCVPWLRKAIDELNCEAAGNLGVYL